MRNFHDSSARDGAARLLALTGRLTILNEKDPQSPLKLLASTASAMLAGDCMGAYLQYHALCRALAASPARRVSGDLFLDHLIWLAIEYEHPFALSAAEGRLDEAELMLFQNDLEVLGELAALGSADISRMCIRRSRDMQNRSRYARDDISVMSTAAWGGTEPKPRQFKDAQLPGDIMAPPQPPAEGEWLGWNYGDKEPRGEYAADEVLEEMYLRLMEAPSWKSMAEDLFNLFASCGTGKFLKYRIFDFYAPNALQGAALPASAAQLSCQEAARQALTDRVIDFMRGGVPSPVLISGAQAMGKATLALSMAEEFPELRIVRVLQADEGQARALMAQLGRQPLRFMLFMPNAQNIQPAALRAFCGHELPPNVLPVATAAAAAGFEAFPARISIAPLELDTLALAAKELVAAYSPYGAADAAWIRNAAVDHQLDAKDALNLAAAKLIAAQYIAAHE